MKYVMVWRERAWGSAEDAEAAQERVLETDDLEALHQFASTFAVFEFVMHPVIDVGVALAAEGAAVAWRRSMGAG